MKNKLKIILLITSLLVYNCYVGTERDSCRYYLKKESRIECDPGAYAIFNLPREDGRPLEVNNTAVTLLALSCYLYLEELKKCDDDNNRFKPGLYGMELEINRIKRKNSSEYRQFFLNTSRSSMYDTVESSAYNPVRSDPFSTALCVPDQAVWRRKGSPRS